MTDECEHERVIFKAGESDSFFASTMACANCKIDLFEMLKKEATLAENKRVLDEAIRLIREYGHMHIDDKYQAEYEECRWCNALRCALQELDSLRLPKTSA